MLPRINRMRLALTNKVGLFHPILPQKTTRMFQPSFFRNFHVIFDPKTIIDESYFGEGYQNSIIINTLNDKITMRNLYDHIFLHQNIENKINFFNLYPATAEGFLRFEQALKQCGDKDSFVQLLERDAKEAKYNYRYFLNHITGLSTDKLTPLEIVQSLEKNILLEEGNNLKQHSY